MGFIIDRFSNGIETVSEPLYDNPYSYGRIEIGNNCNGCGKCADSCVVNAVSIKDGKAVVDYKKCIYCRNCSRVCERAAAKMTGDYKLGSLERSGEELKHKIYDRFKRSIILRSVDTGSCNACMLELSSTQNTYYSLSRYGINFAASPRHSDGIVVTGPVTLNMKEALIKTYYAMPEPRIVIAVGTCAYDGGVFRNCYSNFRELHEIIPVDMVIPGCPPSPQAIIYGILKLMDRI